MAKHCGIESVETTKVIKHVGISKQIQQFAHQKSSQTFSCAQALMHAFARSTKFLALTFTHIAIQDTPVQCRIYKVRILQTRK